MHDEHRICMMNIETLTVTMVVTLSIAYASYRIFKAFSYSSKCCGCEGCPLHSHCKSPEGRQN